jgi:hypothetical protein
MLDYKPYSMFIEIFVFTDLWGMPCKTYDLSVKVRPWEFGSSPT